MPSKTLTSSGVSSWAEWYDRAATHYKNPMMKMAYYLDGRTGKPVPPSVMKANYADIWKKLKAQKEHIILDAGCGVGFFTKNYKQRVQKIIGTDIAPAMIKEARRTNPGEEFFVCGLKPLPFASETFDRLLCYSVFHYATNLDDAAKTLDEFIRVTKPGGIVFVGDILYPVSAPKKTTPKGQKLQPWWPATLNHQLKKLHYDPSFFMTYGRSKKVKCEILEQHIPGRILPDKRYDVRITIP